VRGKGSQIRKRSWDPHSRGMGAPKRSLMWKVQGGKGGIMGWTPQNKRTHEEPAQEIFTSGMGKGGDSGGKKFCK